MLLVDSFIVISYLRHEIRFVLFRVRRCFYGSGQNSDRWRSFDLDNTMHYSKSLYIKWVTRKSVEEETSTMYGKLMNLQSISKRATIKEIYAMT